MSEGENGRPGLGDVRTLEKELLTDPSIAARSVVRDEPEARLSDAGAGGVYGALLAVIGVAEVFPRWGSNVQLRDAMLRAFATSEAWLASTIASIVARNVAFEYRLNGENEAACDAAHQVLRSANRGEGWESFIGRLCTDLLGQDKGAFVELIREFDHPLAAVVGLQNLDAAMCWLTGNLEHPVVYTDKHGGYHKLKWYQVYHVAEMPMNDTFRPGLQMCAVSRVLQMARIWANEQTYIEEKTGGRHVRAIHVIQGISEEQLKDSLSLMEANASNRGQARYMQPVIAVAMNPNQKPELVTLEMASLPDGWDAEKEMKRYLTLLAMAFLTDYGELAPLPGGQLGSGMQSEIMEAKSKRKGAGLFRRLISRMINDAGVLPEGVEFVYDEQDAEEDHLVATNRKLRLEGLQIAITAGIIDVEVARQLLVEAGDLDEEVLDELALRDVARQAQEEEAAAEEQEREAARFEMQMQRPVPAGPPRPFATTERSVPEKVRAERMELEDEQTAAITDALNDVRLNIARYLRRAG